MSDKDPDLMKLSAALRAATPPHDPAAKAAALAAAMKSFDAHQENAERLRSMQDRPNRGFKQGLVDMFDRLTRKSVLATSASVLVLGVCAVMLTSPEMAALRQGLPADVGADLSEVGPSDEARARPESAPAAGAQPAAGPAPDAAPPPAPTHVAPQAEAVTAQTKMAPVANHAASPAQERALRAPLAPSPVPQAADSVSRMRGASAPMAGQPPQPSADHFATFDPNPLKIASVEPVSTFSIDVDTAAWSWARGALRMGQLPDPASVRIEEMINYFPYDYPAPAGDAPFGTSVAVFETPWNSATQLVRIGLQGKPVAVEARPPLNLVFLIDSSGSMMGEDRIGLLKTSFGLLLDSLRDEDQVAIITYAGAAGEVLVPTAAHERATIMAALDGLEAGGSTAGSEGLALAYQTAAKMAAEGEVNRIILATDGDFNVGFSDPEALKTYVAKQRKQGSYLSVLGFGRGNLDDALMQALAQNGNGQAAYIDSLEEARKVLVDQASGALFPLADDVKIQVEWNPAVVADYRLIGYETRALAREDFNNDKVDAGEIGAGHQVTALYEITPVANADPLRYAAPATPSVTLGEAGWLKLRYKAPGASDSQLIETPIPAEASPADSEARFAAAIAAFGQMLSEPKYLGDFGYEALIALAQSGRGEDPFGYRAEAISLMRAAQALAK